MAKDTPDLTLGPWPKGMNNRTSETSIPQNEQLRDALNLDVDSEGGVRRRIGTTRIVSATDVRSLFSTPNGLLYVQGQELRLRVNSSSTLLRSDMTPGRRTSYVRVPPLGTYYSDGVVRGRLLDDGTHLSHWNVARPAGAPNISVGTGGVLHPGRYRVKITFVGSNGEESPPSAEAAVDIAAGQHIVINSFPTTADAFVTLKNVYVTRANDDTFFLVNTLAIGVTSSTVLSVNDSTVTLGTNLLEAFPPVEMVDYFAGRLWGSAGNVLWYSEPLRYGLLTPRHCYFLFPAEISIHAGCEDGKFVVADKVYWLNGTDPAKMTRSVRFEHPAAKYSLSRMKNAPRVVWFSPYGYVMGGPGGEVVALSEERIAAPAYAEGETLFREQNGLRQIIGNFKADAESPLQMSDFADMEIVRSGA